MDDAAGQTPEWARKAERKRPVFGGSVSPFDALDAAWKAREAVGGGVLAAVAMSGLNLLTGAILWSGRYPEHWTLARRLNISMPFLNLVAAIVLLLVAANLHRTRSVTVAWVVLAWTIADVVQISAYLYGHAGLRFISPFLVFVAIMGVRGAMRLRRFEREAPEPQGV